MAAEDDVEAVCAALERSLALTPATSSGPSAGDGGEGDGGGGGGGDGASLAEAVEIRSLLRRNLEELSGALKALNGEYVLPAVGGDLLRDGPGVLPTGRGLHSSTFRLNLSRF